MEKRQVETLKSINIKVEKDRTQYVNAMENSEETKPELQKKLSKVKIFQLLRESLVATGINPTLATQTYPINWKISMGFLILILSVICNLMYTLYEAETFAEYTQSAYMGSLAAVIFLDLVIILLNVTKLFDLIDGSGNLANTSK